MKHGMQVGLGSGHIALDGDPAPAPQKWGQSPPKFLAHVYSGHMAGWIEMPLGTELGLGQGYIVSDGDPAPPKTGHNPHCLLWLNGWLDQDATWYEGRPWPGQHCV